MWPLRTLHVFSRVGHHRSWRQQLIGKPRRERRLVARVWPCAGALRVCRALREKYKNDPRHAEYRDMLAATSDDLL